MTTFDLSRLDHLAPVYETFRKSGSVSLTHPNKVLLAEAARELRDIKVVNLNCPSCVAATFSNVMAYYTEHRNASPEPVKTAEPKNTMWDSLDDQALAEAYRQKYGRGPNWNQSRASIIKKLSEV